MPDVRVLIWNVRFFNLSTLRYNSGATRLLKMLAPVAGAAWDIFMMVEPKDINPLTNVGSISTRGSSTQALATLLFLLQSRDLSWWLVSPRALTTSNNKEAHGVFY